MNGILSKKTFLSIFVFLAFPFFLHAQSIELKASSLYPSTGDNVTISLSSFDIDINSLEVSWFKNGKFEKKGIGLKNYSLLVSEGENVVRASVKLGDKSLDQSIKVNSSSMDVLWEVVGGYEPPFYKGKIVPIKGSKIRVVAIPQIKNEKGFVIDSGSFIYAWRKDGSNFPGQSGYGINNFLYSPQILDRDNSIEVSASSSGRSLSKSLTVTPSLSEIHFYEYDLVYGPLYNKALKEGQTINTRKINILSEPYFIFTNDINAPSLVTEWKVNNVVTKPANNNLVLLDISEKINKVEVEFKTDNKNQLLQGMTRKLKLNILTN